MSALFRNFGGVNQKLHIALLMLGMMTLMSGICFAQYRSDSALLNRVWSYQQNHIQSIAGKEKNVYMVCEIGSKRRNPLLFLIPTMYSIAKGEKHYIIESYCKLKFRSRHDYDMRRQVVCGTIPSNRKVMPVLYEMCTPDIYGEQLYSDRLLSPFHRSNHEFYRYRIRYENDDRAYLTFTPRIDNTQLVTGDAVIEPQSGRILYVVFKGEFDMVRFRVTTTMNPDDPYGMPESCNTKASFKFVGNNIYADFTSYYDCQHTLPDSIDNVNDPKLMESLRPIALTHQQSNLYYVRDSVRHQEELADTLPRKNNRLRDVAWDVIGNHMINSTRFHSENSSLRISPLFNPLYMSYSSSRGIAYKLKIHGNYNWNARRYLTLDSRIGYNTKKNQFYYTIPLRMTYNPKRNGFVELTWGNGDRTSNDALADAFHQKMGEDVDMPEFRDEYIQAINNIALFDWMEISAGLVYRIRKSINPSKMEAAGLQTKFRTFSPVFAVRLQPWEKGPRFTANYERSIPNLFNSNLRYERWELDLAYKYNVKGMRIFNFRAGTGFYTNRSSNYFVYYTNFRDENLPSGWEDDWSGQFQLAPGGWYNQSNYYLRGHISYDSPLLALSWLPWVGHFVETERIYLSSLNIEHTRPFFELGYGFKCRYISIGLFTSFLNFKQREFGFKFTFELFRRW